MDNWMLSREAGCQNNYKIQIIQIHIFSVPTSSVGLQLLPLGHASLLNSTNGSTGA